MSTLVFFPWFGGLKGVTRIGDFSLIPFARGIQPGGPDTNLQKILDEVTERYVIIPNKPISHASVVQLGSSEITTDLSEVQVASVFAFSELVAVSGLSTLIWGHYTSF